MIVLCRSALGLVNDMQAQRLKVSGLNEEIELLRNQHEVTKKSTEGWAGFRKFRVDRLQRECDLITSVYLTPHDGKSLPSFLPGQYLTIQWKVPGHSKPIVRCYSLSDGPGRNYYRCTIKQVMPPAGQPEAPPGIASTYINEVLREGDILDVKAPRGNFVLDINEQRPVVLLAAGIGVTPLASMLHALCNSGSDRKAIMIYGVGNSLGHALNLELSSLCSSHDTVQQVICYSSPLESDVIGRHYHVAGRISISLLRELLQSNDFEFYLCGPSTFMTDLVEGLIAWGVPAASIHSESFGPAAVKKRTVPMPAEGQKPGPQVAFDRSDKIVQWDPNSGSLLELAESQGVEVESGCRAGNCGTCALAIKSGRVAYLEDPNCEVEKGTCLPCVCIPDGPIVLDA